MRELFQLSFRCTKLKCGIIWAFVVMSAPEPQRGRHLGSAACRTPCEEPSRGGARRGGRQDRVGGVASLVLGAFCAVGAVFASRSRRFHAEHKYKLKNLWNPSWKVLRMYLFCFTFVLFSLGILQALYFSLILSRCNFLFRSKCYEILYYNCKLKLWTFSPFTRTAQKVVQ